MNAFSPPFYGRTYPNQASPLVWEATQALQNALAEQSTSMGRAMELAMSLHEVLESNREMYNNMISERDEAYRRLQDADAKLQQVEHVVRRYAEVKDPVVASDGYTYERVELSRYLQDCKASNSKAYSQQTKEELTDAMVDNVSLRRLAELLKGVHTVEVPPLTKRVPIVGGSVGLDGPRGRWADEEGGMGGGGGGGARHVDMSPGPAGHTSGGGGRGMGGGGHGGRRFDRAGGAGGAGAGGKYGKPSHSGEGKGGLHPCLRVYGFCNFEDDCTFANYPYEACLNHIKGKCRFGSTCKELHVDPRDPAYQNTNSYANHAHHQGGGNAANNRHGSQESAKDGESTAQAARRDGKAKEGAETPSAASAAADTPANSKEE